MNRRNRPQGRSVKSMCGTEDNKLPVAVSGKGGASSADVQFSFDCAAHCPMRGGRGRGGGFSKKELSPLFCSYLRCSV